MNTLSWNQIAQAGIEKNHRAIFGFVTAKNKTGALLSAQIRSSIDAIRF